MGGGVREGGGARVPGRGFAPGDHGDKPRGRRGEGRGVVGEWTAGRW